jgi:L-asparaginase
MMRGGPDTPLRPQTYAQDLLAEVPVLANIADIDTRVVAQTDSSDMVPEDWVALARIIHESLPDYDGVVIIHGTDTMAYTASALAFLLEDLDRPVILTGSQRPIHEMRTDARQNLIDAFQLATMAIPEVGLAFAAKLLRGCRTTKVDAWGFDAFDSPMCPPLAKLGVGVELGTHVLAPRTRRAFDPRLETNVLAVRLFPGLDPGLLLGALDRGVRGLVLKAFGAGNVPMRDRSLIPVIEHARALDVPVVIASQCHRAHVDLARYEGGSAAQKAGAIGAGDMTDETALTKLMVVLGRHQSHAGDDKGSAISRVEAARRAFSRSFAGEISEMRRRSLFPPAPGSSSGGS